MRHFEEKDMELLPGMLSTALDDLSLPPVSLIGKVMQDLREGVRFCKDSPAGAAPPSPTVATVTMTAPWTCTWTSP